MNNFKPEVLVNDNWLASDLVFPNEEAAKEFAFSLFDVWVLAQNFRAVPTDLPVNLPSLTHYG